MAVVPQIDRRKLIEFDAPRTSVEFRERHEFILGDGKLISGMTVSSDGSEITVGPGVFSHAGVLVEILSPQQVELPLSYPAVLYASTIDQDNFSDVELGFVTPGAPVATFYSPTSFVPVFDASMASMMRRVRALNPGPNYLINAGFQVDQRAITANQNGPGDGPFGMDAWKPFVDGGTTGDVDFLSTITPGEFVSGTSGGKVVVTIGDSTSAGIKQSVYGHEEFRGSIVTVSGMVRSDVASVVTLTVDDGVSPVTSTAHTGSDLFERLTAVIEMDSAASQLVVTVESSADEEFFVDEFVLALGNFPSGVKYWPSPMDIQEIEALSIYETGSYESWALGSDDGTNYDLRVTVPFGTPKIDTPIVTISNEEVRDEGVDDSTDTSGSYTVSVESFDRNGFVVLATKANGGGAVPRPTAVIFDWEAEV